MLQKILLFILAFFIPWLSSMLIGYTGQGVIQLILDIIAFLFLLTGIGAIIGIPIHFITTIWGMVLVGIGQKKPKGINREREY